MKFLIVICFFMISACGMQGDLYLPEDRSAQDGSTQNGSNQDSSNNKTGKGSK